MNKIVESSLPSKSKGNVTTRLTKAIINHADKLDNSEEVKS